MSRSAKREGGGGEKKGPKRVRRTQERIGDEFKGLLGEGLASRKARLLSRGHLALTGSGCENPLFALFSFSRRRDR